MINNYIGHELQLYGVKEIRLIGGKADGMRLLSVKNGKGLAFEVSLDRCGDISLLSLKGDNMGYFSPCGYVSPKYYDNKGDGFLKSFTGGFFTTCGLTAVGTPCTDNGEELPLHGTISNTPCETFRYFIQDSALHIELTVRDAALFSHHLVLEREYVCPLDKNEIRMTDRIKNTGPRSTPLEVLYHCNMGYPLLSEHARVTIPSSAVVARDEHAKEGIEACLVMEKPQRGYVETCYYHTLSGKTCVSVYNGDIKKGVRIKYDAESLPYFTEWKMMGEREYVLGLEPGNCLPDGRSAMREKGILETLEPGQERAFQITFEFVEEELC